MGSPNPHALVPATEGEIRSLPTPTRASVSLPSPEEIKGLQAYGEMIAQSKLFPNVTSWQGAIMIARYGQQLGVDEFTALTQIYWINGVPTCSAQLMNALITRDHGGDAIQPVESTPEICRISYKRREWSERREATLRIEDVPDSVKNNPKSFAWKTYPTDMLFARTISRIARQSFPDTIRGLYTREEIEDSQAIEVRGRVVSTPSRSPEHPRQEPVIETTTAMPPEPPVAEAATFREVDAAAEPPSKIVQTWLNNIQRATTLERLDQITDTLTNIGMQDTPALVEAIRQRRAEMNGTA